ncbi:DUF6069 family protein [Glycomyces terrestris]|uniref:Uncharacterized protein n=1 Tax=Glycomyces terrestris TaxID=2493553 RepID=A0A426UZS2_9ACTN|nr:DUF6069 family protein [Glycomyces terrestris]RRS00103.1 hypothetical protein EIW28_05775 [Glycomyces terrestris]
MSKTDSEARPKAAPVWRPRLIALVAAAVAAGLTAVIAAAAGVEMRAANPGQEPIEVGFAAGAVMTLLAGGLGWIARAVLDRFAPRKAVLVWLIGAAAVFAVEMVPPFYTEATTGTRIVLILMHVVVAAVLVPVFGRRRPDLEA